MRLSPPASIHVLAALLLMAVLGIHAVDYECDECPQQQTQLLQVNKRKRAVRASHKKWESWKTYPQFRLVSSWKKDGKTMCLQATSSEEVGFSSCKKGSAAQGWERDEQDFEWNMMGSKATKFQIRSLQHKDKCLAYTTTASCSAGTLAGFKPVHKGCSFSGEHWSYQTRGPIKLVSCNTKLPRRRTTMAVPLTLTTRLYAKSRGHGYLTWHDPSNKYGYSDYCLDASGTSDEVLLYRCKTGEDQWTNNQRWTMTTK